MDENSAEFVSEVLVPELSGYALLYSRTDGYQSNIHVAQSKSHEVNRRVFF